LIHNVGPRQPNRAWPVAPGFIYVVNSYPRLAALAKTMLELEGFSACAFEDRIEAWRAFAFAYPRPALLITDNLDGDAPAIGLIRQCRRVEPDLKTLLVESGVSTLLPEQEADLINGQLSLPYCGPLLLQEVRRLCASRSGRTGACRINSTLEIASS